MRWNGVWLCIQYGALSIVLRLLALHKEDGFLSYMWLCPCKAVKCK